VTSSRFLWLRYPDDKDSMILWNAGRDSSNNLITSQKTYVQHGYWDLSDISWLGK